MRGNTPALATTLQCLLARLSLVLLSCALASTAHGCGEASQALAGAPTDMDGAGGTADVAGMPGLGGARLAAAGGAESNSLAGAGAPSAGGAGDSAGQSALGGAASGGNAGGAAGLGGAAGQAGANEGMTAGQLRHVFVLALENHDDPSIIGNTVDAPFLNSLLPSAARADNFIDELPLTLPSEPHYIWMEAGTNVFADHTFDTNGHPSALNSTADTQHLSTQLDQAGLVWMSYQEGITAYTGTCPVRPSGFYVPRHNPFVFFQDVTGLPLSKTNVYCSQHHKPLSALLADLESDMPAYNFITPDLCHDMHGASGCPEPNKIKAGDDWLAANLPPLLAYLEANAGVLFVTWDEGEHTLELPFLALGPTVKHGYVGSVEYTHSSLLKSVEKILGVPVLARVEDANDFADLFELAPF